MNNYKNKTTTELLKLINDLKSNYDILKQEIIDYSVEIDEIEKIINEKIIKLTNFEKNYISLIEEFNRR
jgi:uncharacterized coiled-coil DUF342 family protein